jgi:hypothetical protein
MKETNKLIVGQDGILKDSGVKEVSVNDYEELLSINYEPKNDWLILQPLPEKEKTTSSGIIIPGGSLKEFKCVIVAAPVNSEYSRGQVVRLDPMMFGQNGPRAEYIETQPFVECPTHFVKGVYTNINLADWKA